MINYFKLIRPANVLFVFIVQLLMICCVIEPIVSVSGINLFIPMWAKILLILTTVSNAAAGYVINDYFDMKIDRINRPNSIIVGSAISQKQTMLFYQVLVSIAVVSGLVLAVFMKNVSIGLCVVAMPGLLWFYSSTYKRQFLVGNLIVSLAAALVPIMVSIAQNSVIQSSLSDTSQFIFVMPVIKQVYAFGLGFGLFAFLLTLIREIVKDIEDAEGDREFECRTIPIVWGEHKTKQLLTILITLTIIGIMYAATIINFPIQESMTRYYATSFLVAPLSVLVFYMFKSKTREDYKRLSLFLKLIMVAGMSYAVVYYYLLAKSYGIIFLNLFFVV